MIIPTAPVYLKTIQFDWPENLDNLRTFPLRIDYGKGPLLPEWNRDPGSLSHAAYSTHDQAAQQVAVRVTLWNNAANPLRVVLEAVADPGGSVLGDVPPVELEVPAGGELLHVLVLPEARLVGAAVGLHPFKWLWKIRPKTGEPADTVTSEHRIYTTLTLPEAPWAPSPGQLPEVPWPAALFQACVWADGATTLSEAANKITSYVFGLGRTNYKPRSSTKYLEWKPSHGFTDIAGPHVDTELSVHYKGNFLCTRFLKRMVGQYSSGQLNCMDCAAIVSTFANLLGCGLDQVRFPGFSTNYIILIGGATGEWLMKNFAQHEVAILGTRCEPEFVWDACLRLNNPNDSGAKMEKEAENLPLYEMNGPLSYRSLLAIPAHVPRVEPVEYYRERRPFLPTKTFFLDGDLLHQLFPWGYQAPVDWPQPTALPVLPPEQAENLPRFPRALPGWQRAGLEELPEVEWATAWQTTWIPATDIPDGGETLDVLIYLCRSTDPDARAPYGFLWQLVQRVHTVEAQQQLEAPPGDVAYGDGETFIAFVRGYVLVVLAGSSPRGSLLKEAQQIDQELQTLIQLA